MDYEQMDKEMSSFVITGKKNGTRFYLTDQGTYSDIRSHARLFRWEDVAEPYAEYENKIEPSFHWQVMSYPEAYVQD